MDGDMTTSISRESLDLLVAAGAYSASHNRVMVGVTILVLSASSFLVSWHQPAVPLRQPLAQGRVGIGPYAALDMKDPDVAKEYAAVMAFDTEKIVDELEASGIRPPPTMSAFGRWPNSGSDLARRRQPPITHRVRVLLLLRRR
jgi:hypothetical protein